MQEVHTLICSNDVEMALSCLGSLLQYSSEPIRIIFHDDGSLTKYDVELLLNKFIKSKIVLRKDSDDIIKTRLKNYPNCLKFRNENTLALKLFDVPLLSDDNIAYCDTDVLFFRPFQGLFTFDNEKTSCLFMKDYQEAYSLYPWQLLGPSKIELISKLNTGLFLIRNEIYDINFFEWMLSKINFRPIIHWIEQTCWSIFAYRSGCRMWNPDMFKVITNNTKISDDLIGGHFTRSVRYRLEQYEQLNKINHGNPIKVSTEDCKKCTAFSIAYERGRDRINRLIKL